MEDLGKDTVRQTVKLATKDRAIRRPWSDAPKGQLEDHGYIDEVDVGVNMPQRLTTKFEISGKKQENAAHTTAAELYEITAQGEEVPRLIAEEDELRETLAAPPHAPPASAPSTWEQELHQLSRHVVELTEDGCSHLLVGTPHGRFSALREEIVATAQPVIVKREPRTEQDIGLKHSADFQLSASDIPSVEENLPRELEAKRPQKHASLVGQLALYLERPDPSVAEQQKLKRSHSGLNLATLNALRQKTAECKVLKQETTKALITRVQDELLAWFRTCCVTEREDLLEEGWDSQDWQEVAMKESSAVSALQTLEDFSCTTGSAPGKAALPRAPALLNRAGDPTRLIRDEIERLDAQLPTKEAAA